MSDVDRAMELPSLYSCRWVFGIGTRFWLMYTVCGTVLCVRVASRCHLCGRVCGVLTMVAAIWYGVREASASELVRGGVPHWQV